LLISIIIGLSLHRFDILFAFVISLPFPTLAVFLSYLFTNLIFSFFKNGGQKKQIIVFSMFLFVVKYIVVVTPLIIGLIVNGATHTTVFNPFALVIGALIYPMTTLIVQ
jgi:ABC-type multidrug transport system fused ATPase/permease subunit